MDRREFLAAVGTATRRHQLAAATTFPEERSSVAQTQQLIQTLASVNSDANDNPAAPDFNPNTDTIQAAGDTEALRDLGRGASIGQPFQGEGGSNHFTGRTGASPRRIPVTRMVPSTSSETVTTQSRGR